MKKLLIAAVLAAGMVVAKGQGTIDFKNLVGALDAPLTFGGALRPNPTVPDDVLGNAFVAQLWDGSGDNNIGGAVFFDERPAFAGIWAGETRTLDAIAPGGTANVRVRAWATDLAANWEDAVALNIGGTYDSGAFDVEGLGGGGPPPAPPAIMQNFTGGEISAIVPEPSIAALGLLGAGLLLLRRKK